MANTALSVSFSSLVVLAACSTVPPVPVSEEVSTRPAFRQALRDATTDALVVNLAAHPDDEANTTLVYLRRAHGLRTVTMYSTSGGGGQNAISREIGPDLARLRTRETLAAASLSGTQVRRLGFSDFGYSKSADEAFSKWGKDLYVERLAAVVDEVGERAAAELVVRQVDLRPCTRSVSTVRTAVRLRRGPSQVSSEARMERLCSSGRVLAARAKQAAAGVGVVEVVAVARSIA